MGPKINSVLCEGCEKCIEVCPADVFEMEDGIAKAVRYDDCLDCGACMEECPSQAISFED